MTTSLSAEPPVCTSLCSTSDEGVDGVEGVEGVSGPLLELLPPPPPPPPPHATNVIKNRDAKKFLTAIVSPGRARVNVKLAGTLVNLFMKISCLQILVAIRCLLPILSYRPAAAGNNRARHYPFFFINTVPTGV